MLKLSHKFRMLDNNKVFELVKVLGQASFDRQILLVLVSLYQIWKDDAICDIDALTGVDAELEP